MQVLVNLLCATEPKTCLKDPLILDLLVSAADQLLEQLDTDDFVRFFDAHYKLHARIGGNRLDKLTNHFMPKLDLSSMSVNSVLRLYRGVAYSNQEDLSRGLRD